MLLPAGGCFFAMLMPVLLAAAEVTATALRVAGS
jgi:hypothetical protein